MGGGRSPKEAHQLRRPKLLPLGRLDTRSRQKNDVLFSSSNGRVTLQNCEVARLARPGNCAGGEFPDLQSGVREGAVRISRCTPRDAARGEDYFEVARRTALLIDRCANLNVADSINGHALAYRRGTGGGDVARTCRHRARCGNSPGSGDSALVGQATGFNDL
jgi:hypothetical protein